MNAIDAFGLFVLALFRRAPKPAPVMPAEIDTLDDPLAELRAALERQIELDEAKRKRWGENG